MISEREAAAMLDSWIAAIESIEVDGWRRHCRRPRDFSRSGFDLSRGSVYSRIEIDPLSKGGEEIDDYQSKMYSRWAFRLSEHFREWLGHFGEPVLNSSNWTRIWVPGLAEFEYSVFWARMSAEPGAWLAMERSRKLKGLGI